MRIVLISKFNKSDEDKIAKLVSMTNIKTCKLSYGIHDENRKEYDTLPYHITIFGTNKENENKFIELINTIKIGKININVIDIDIMLGNDNSKVLYLELEENEKLKELQGIIRKYFPSKYYNPEIYKFHITIDIDKDEEKINMLYEKILDEFKPFSITLDELALYDYPGNMIKTFKLN